MLDLFLVYPFGLHHSVQGMILIRVNITHARRQSAASALFITQFFASCKVGRGHFPMNLLQGVSRWLPARKTQAPYSLASAAATAADSGKADGCSAHFRRTHADGAMMFIHVI